MEAAQGGDRQAYAQILKEIAVFARALVRRFHANPSTIEDVVQDTLLTIHRVRHTYEPGRSVHAWVAAIVRRRSIDTLRSQRRRNVSSVPFEEHDIADDRANHGEAFAHRAEIADALNSLPPAQREAIRLLKVEELSLDEASKISGHSVLALKSLVYRAVKTLRERIAGGLDG
ncbi:MAG: RNA polymerase sigma factor [Micropepsaceae bacterium]